jgi:hypothetical protein
MAMPMAPAAVSNLFRHIQLPSAVVVCYCIILSTAADEMDIFLLFQKFSAPPLVPVAMPPVYAPPSRPALASKNQQDSQLQLQAQPVRVDSIDLLAKIIC